MNDFTFMKKMNEEDAYLFKRCIRKMLDTTFIVADKDEKLYDFISSESNQYDVWWMRVQEYMQDLQIRYQ